LRTATPLAALVAFVIVFTLATTARGEDTVLLKPETPGGPLVRLRGEIVDYSGRELRIRNPEGHERRVPAAQVERVDTPLQPEHETGDQQFRAGDFRAAVASYRKALAAAHEPREWVRRIILAQLVWSLRNLDEWDQAGETFLTLLASDPDTPEFACLPLVWTDRRLEAAIERKALQWLADEDHPAAMLMGASLLLSSSHRPRALAKLQLLLADADPRVAWLAFGQLWRAGSGNATSEQQQSFARRIEASDPKLRAGHYFVLGRSLAREQPEQAAIALLRVPIQYEREYELAAQALIEAGACLEQLQRTSQAEALYSEVGRRFSHSVAAPLADKHLRRLAQPGPARDNGT
jgi:tetratricopeptide (TPR) repeat protein